VIKVVTWGNSAMTAFDLEKHVSVVLAGSQGFPASCVLNPFRADCRGSTSCHRSRARAAWPGGGTRRGGVRARVVDHHPVHGAPVAVLVAVVGAPGSVFDNAKSCVLENGQELVRGQRGGHLRFTFTRCVRGGRPCPGVPDRFLEDEGHFAAGGGPS
jgi:hypothetical protein